MHHRHVKTQISALLNMVQHFNWHCWWWISLLYRASSAVQHYTLNKVSKNLSRTFLYVTMRSLSFKVSNSTEKNFHAIKSLDLSESLSTNRCNGWRTQRVIFCSIQLHHRMIHPHLILLRSVQQKGYCIPNPLLYCPVHKYHQLAPCLHCWNPHHQAHPKQVWYHLKMAQHSLDPKAT